MNTDRIARARNDRIRHLFGLMRANAKHALTLTRSKEAAHLADRWAGLLLDEIGATLPHGAHVLAWAQESGHEPAKDPQLAIAPLRAIEVRYALWAVEHLQD